MSLHVLLLIAATSVYIGCAAVVEKRQTDDNTAEETAPPYIEGTVAPYIEFLRGRDGRDGRDGEPGPRGLPGRDGKGGTTGGER